MWNVILLNKMMESINILQLHEASSSLVFSSEQKMKNSSTRPSLMAYSSLVKKNDVEDEGEGWDQLLYLEQQLIAGVVWPTNQP